MKVKVLECQSGVGKTSGRPYNIALVQIDSGRVGKIYSDVALPVDASKEVDVEVVLAPNKELFLSPKVTGLAK